MIKKQQDQEKQDSKETDIIIYSDGRTMLLHQKIQDTNHQNANTKTSQKTNWQS